ncbi:catalase, partial [Streptomyces sp. RPT161]|uniref:catalase n=1 Tax=Streptomyces sp. RPT161 TaxID=3015993 RepID=UPI0022B9154F
LDRNPQNFFAETEQVAFHTANVVPGIDFTNDPLLQGRNFSYLDTQLIRLGGPNFAQLPVNRPIADVNTNHRDGYGQQVIQPGNSYFPNSLSGGCPAHAGAGDTSGVFRHYQERVAGEKVRVRSDSFKDHYSQATLFWNSMSDWEKAHIVEAFRFELGKVGSAEVRERMVANLSNVHGDLCAAVAAGLGLPAPRPASTVHTFSSPALSQENLAGNGTSTRKVAVLAADGTDVEQVEALRGGLTEGGAVVEVLAASEGSVRGTDTAVLDVDRALPTMGSVLYDALLVPGGKQAAQTLLDDPAAVRFVEETYRHGKPIAVLGEGKQLLTAARLPAEVLNGDGTEQGVISADSADDIADAFASAIARHRFMRRPGLLNPGTVD